MILSFPFAYLYTINFITVSVNHLYTKNYLQNFKKNTSLKKAEVKI